jgi:5-methylcytosine-specific restriction endonuclease McrA
MPKGIYKRKEGWRNQGTFFKGMIPWNKGKKLPHLSGENSPSFKEKILKICTQCSKQYKVIPYREKISKFCSYKCRGDWRAKNLIGEKSFNWQGGVTPHTKRRCNYAKWIKLRKEIYKRDNWTCQRCFKHCRNKEIQCHHIVPYRISKNNHKSNLITLCKKCHTTIEPRGKKSDENATHKCEKTPSFKKNKQVSV